MKFWKLVNCNVGIGIAVQAFVRARYFGLRKFALSS